VSFKEVMDAVRNRIKRAAHVPLSLRNRSHDSNRGLVDETDQIENAVVAYNFEADPLFLEASGERFSRPEMRRGITDFNGMGDSVGGIILMRQR